MCACLRVERGRVLLKVGEAVPFVQVSVFFSWVHFRIQTCVMKCGVRNSDELECVFFLDFIGLCDIADATAQVFLDDDPEVEDDRDWILPEVFPVSRSFHGFLPFPTLLDSSAEAGQWIARADELVNGHVGSFLLWAWDLN
jgi:hypothetical protein